NIEFFPYDEHYPIDIAGEKPIAPNNIAWSQRDYGNRVGVFRLMDILAQRKIRATVALNSDVCVDHPRIIERAISLERELMGQCETNVRPLHKFAGAEQRQVIARTLSTIEKASGRRPSGWLGAGLIETWETLEHLAAEGCRYVGDFANDDQPFEIDVGTPPL